MRISDWSSDVCSSDLERGAMLVDHDILLNEINEYNREKFETEAVELFPGKSPRDDLALPFAVRKAAGIHHPSDRKSVVSGKSVSVRVDLGGRRIINKKTEEIQG